MTEEGSVSYIPARSPTIPRIQRRSSFTVLPLIQGLNGPASTLVANRRPGTRLEGYLRIEIILYRVCYKDIKTEHRVSSRRQIYKL